MIQISSALNIYPSIIFINMYHSFFCFLGVDFEMTYRTKKRVINEISLSPEYQENGMRFLSSFMEITSYFILNDDAYTCNVRIFG